MGATMVKEVYKTTSEKYGELTIKYMDSNSKWLTDKLGVERDNPSVPKTPKKDAPLEGQEVKAVDTSSTTHLSVPSVLPAAPVIVPIEEPPQIQPTERPQSSSLLAAAEELSRSIDAELSATIEPQESKLQTPMLDVTEECDKDEQTPEQKLREEIYESMVTRLQSWRRNLTEEEIKKIIPYKERTVSEYIADIFDLHFDTLIIYKGDTLPPAVVPAAAEEEKKEEEIISEDLGIDLHVKPPTRNTVAQTQLEGSYNEFAEAVATFLVHDCTFKFSANIVVVFRGKKRAIERMLLKPVEVGVHTKSEIETGWPRSLLYDLEVDEPLQFIQKNLSIIENPEFTRCTVFGVCCHDENNKPKEKKQIKKTHFKNVEEELEELKRKQLEATREKKIRCPYELSLEQKIRICSALNYSYAPDV